MGSRGGPGEQRGEFGSEPIRQLCGRCTLESRHLKHTPICASRLLVWAKVSCGDCGRRALIMSELLHHKIVIHPWDPHSAVVRLFNKCVGMPADGPATDT